MILVIEIAFLIAGLYAIFTAKMPSWIVGKGFKAEGTPVRWLGLLMAALLPGIFCVGLGVGILAGMNNFDPTILLAAIEIVTVIVVAIIVTVLLRRIRQPDMPTQQTPTQLPGQNQE